MKDLVLLLVHLLSAVARLLGPGGAKGLVAENLILKQQLLILTRSRQRAPNLTPLDRIVLGLGSLFLRPARLEKVAVALRPATLLAFHQCLIRRKYRALFSSSRRAKPGPKGPVGGTDPCHRGAQAPQPTVWMSADRTHNRADLWYTD